MKNTRQGETIITPAHLRRGGLNKPGRFVSPTGTLVCSSCGKEQGETHFYKRGPSTGLRQGSAERSGTAGFQQPCGPCKYARLKAKRKSGSAGSPTGQSQAISEPHNPRHAEPGSKQVACPYPRCKFYGTYVELNKHRKEHDHEANRQHIPN